MCGGKGSDADLQLALHQLETLAAHLDQAQDYVRQLRTALNGAGHGVTEDRETITVTKLPPAHPRSS